MALQDEVTTRVSAAKLLNLTNPDKPNATTTDTTRLAAACTDAEADFKLYADVTFDSSDARHVRIGVNRVVALLLSRMTGDLGAAERALAETEKQLAALRQTSSRGRILPQTNQVATPTEERSVDGTTVRPDFDRTRFRDFVPGAPPAVDPWGS